MKAITLEMTKDKITKGAVRYSDGDGHNIYFKKGELPSDPDAITVTVQES